MMRTLDPNRKKALVYFYTPTSQVGVYLAVFLPITLGLGLLGPFWNIYYGLATGTVVTLLLLLLRGFRIKRRIARALFIYENGQEERLVFKEQSNNYAIKLNGAPQQVISLERNGTPVQIKTFNPYVISVYTIPKQSVYTHDRYPGMMVPAGLFTLPEPPPRRTGCRALGWLLFLILPLSLVVGIIYIINRVMESHSNTYAQPDALVYVLEGKPVLATAVTHFQASEVSNAGTFGSTNCYAEGMDLETGKRLWKVNFHGNGGVRLLGQSARYLFFYNDGLYVVDKQEEKVVARNEDFPAIRDKMSSQPVGDYEGDAGYAYDDSLQALVVKGTDGLFYTIDGTSLKTGTIDIPDPDGYFKNPFQFGNNYEDHIASTTNDGPHCMVIREPVRRTLYSCASDTTRLNGSVFLFGGFLVDAAAPLRTASGGFVLLHKSSIEPDATLLLTGISSSGGTLWQVNTGYAAIPFRFHDQAGDALYVAGNTRGGNGDQLNEVTRIDLKTGEKKIFSF
ncbi:PA2928 family protein [Dinghuibacter silviterrae]|uniref:Uncharacterized protein n=1 Tax=Dinghuibacter silviterrae TaxID=1539049 RepID=A0A4R8DFD9_9BACT|nr:PA2928 family protein [Dinghuibacter silviterrae]TDW96175.1 hypothetical protein EDB95_3998 [Dinghuibacter silviterrae]